MQEWLPIIAVSIGALAAFGVWAYVSRQRLVVKVILFESGRQRGADILFQIDLDVVSFSLIYGRNFWHGVVFL